MSFSDGNATIANKKDNTRKIRWNNGSPRFACYTTGQQDVQLYKRVEVATHTLTINPPPTGGTITVTDAQQQTVSSDTQIAEGAVLNITATPNAGYEFGSWSATSGTLGDANNASTTFTMGTGNATLSATFTQNNTQYNVNIDSGIENGSITANHTQCVSGTTVTLTITPANNYHLETLSITDDDGNVIDYDDTEGYTFIMPASDVTVTGMFTNTYTDQLTYALIGVTGTNYTEWSGKTSNSSAVYEGKTAGSNNSIQLNANTTNGIISTTSGGGVQKISVSWQTTPINDRSLKIYGSNTAFGTISNVTSGTPIGTLDATTTYVEPTETFMYIGMVGNGGAIYMDEIDIKWGPVTTYTVSINENIEHGSVSASPTTAPAGATINLTATPENHYVFDEWNVTAGNDPIEVSNNTFTMPSSNVTVSATFVDAPTYGITVASGVATMVSTGVQTAYAGDEVTITVNGGNQVLQSLTVTGNVSGNSVTVSPAVTPSVSTYTFTMPAEAVTIDATFSQPQNFTVSFSVNGDIQSINPVQVTQGQSTQLPTDVQVTGYTLMGWSESLTDIILLTGSYAPTQNITLYAVLVQEGGGETGLTLSITANTTNYPTSYPSNTTNYTLEGKVFALSKTSANNGKLQFQKSNNGNIYNVENFGVIKSIVITYNSSDTKKQFTVKAGNSANPTTTSITPEESPTNSSVYTFDLSSYNYSYFILSNGSTNAGYLDDITITYDEPLFTEITEITTSGNYTENINANQQVVISDNAVVTFTGTNNGGATNLVVEDGAQLIHTEAVYATLQKNIAHYTSKDGASGWYTVASPVNGAPVSTLTSDTYDLYSYDEANHQWYNQKAHSDVFTTLSRGQGYLYANSADKVVSFAGSMESTSATVEVTLSKQDGTSLAGYNLVGNPFTRNLTSTDVIKIGGSTDLNTYYFVAGGSELESTTIGERDIKAGEGFFVQASADGEKLTFNYSAKGETAAKPAYVCIEAGDESFMDRAYVQVGQGNTLRKMTLNDNVAHVYVLHNEADYAAATIEAAEGEMPVCFKAAHDGQYTLSVNTKGFDADYLHLIDNFTGADIDLIASPSYTFDAKAADHACRFRLMFDASENNGASTLATAFAYLSNGEIVITGAEADATLQIMDMTGRVVAIRDAARNVSTAGMPAGVYVLRLVNGSDVKTQKMVIR